MAFKRFDFSKLDPNHRVRRDPYEMDDRRLFRNKSGAPRKIHRGTVVIEMDERRIGSGLILDDVSYRARVERDGKTQQITLVFGGERGRAFTKSRLAADFTAAHEARCDAGDYDRRIEMTIEVEGAWAPRNWKDRAGRWHKEWQMVVARWSYTPEGEPTITEGQKPFASSEEAKIEDQVAQTA